jgi:hypothetical protein
MSDGTHIEWTDASWNPLRARREPDSHLGWACVRVSAGCTHCYAATINKRLGTGLDYTVPAMASVSTYLDEGALAHRAGRLRAPRGDVAGAEAAFVPHEPAEPGRLRSTLVVVDGKTVRVPKASTARRDGDGIHVPATRFHAYERRYAGAAS